MSEKPISPLRQRMLEDMNVRRFTPDGQRDYVRASRGLLPSWVGPRTQRWPSALLGTAANRTPALLNSGATSLFSAAAHRCAACNAIQDATVYPNAFFTRSGDIGVSRRRTPVSSATALAIAGATSGVAI